MAIFDELIALQWPEEFIVEYYDGEKEQLLRGTGIFFTPPTDDPEGIGGMSAMLPKKHPQNQDIGRYVRFDQLRAIYTMDGNRLWLAIM